MKIEAVVAHQETGFEMPLSDFVVLTDAKKLMAGYQALSLKSAIEWIERAYGVVIPSQARKSRFDFFWYLVENDLAEGDNTYNYGWFGPTVDYAVSTRTMDGKKLWAVRMHLGGDVRGNYADPEFFLVPEDESPFLQFGVVLSITTEDDRKYAFWSDDPELREWTVIAASDLFEEGDLVTHKEIEEQLLEGQSRLLI